MVTVIECSRSAVVRPDVLRMLQLVGKAPDRLSSYLCDQEEGLRTVLIGEIDLVSAGFVTVLWESRYPPFRARGIPEICDLNVAPEFRRKGVAAALLDRAEALVKERSPICGIGVGLYADYGSAQIMYAKRGYVPDGNGVYYDDKPGTPGAMYRLDDSLVFYLEIYLPRGV